MLLETWNKEQEKGTRFNVVQISMILHPPENNHLHIINKERGDIPNTPKKIGLSTLYSYNISSYDFWIVLTMKNDHPIIDGQTWAAHTK